MTKFERQYNEIINGEASGYEYLMKRRDEIAQLKRELKTCRNSFRATCIMQDLERLTDEYNELEDVVNMIS